MNKKLLMVMLGAFIMAVVVAMIVQASLAPSPKTVAVQPTGVNVLIAKKDLMKGETLKAQDVQWKNYPEDVIFEGMVKKPTEGEPKVYNKVLLRDIVSGEPISTKSLIMDIEGGENNLSAKLAPGMRAVGVNVKADTTAGGFIAPGDRVDVILTYQLKLKGEVAQYSEGSVQRFASETILKNVKVMAVDQTYKEKAFEAKVGRTVTLEVNPEGAQILSMASSMGQISLSLRRMGEGEDEKDIPITTDVMDSKVIKNIYKRMNALKSSSDSVRIYNGTQVIDMPVNSVREERAER